MKRWIMAVVCVAIGLAGANAAVVLESARDIPVAYDVDVVVVGGSTAAVAAAAQAAKDGAKVFLAAPRHYLGDDMCATYRLGLAEVLQYMHDRVPDHLRSKFKPITSTEMQKEFKFAGGTI